LYVARNWRSILAAISVGLGCEAQFRPITDKRASDKTMSNREKTFTLDPLMLDLSANYLMGRTGFAPMAYEGQRENESNSPI
jgi:hypothetical protein